MSHFIRQLQGILKMVQCVLQFALYAQEDAGVAHHGRHSTLVTRLLVVLQGLVVEASRGSEFSFLDRDHTQVEQLFCLTLLIADGSCDGKRLTVQLLSRSEIPLIDRDFRHVVQALRQTAAVSGGFVDLSRFFAGTLGFFVFAKIG